MSIQPTCSCISCHKEMTIQNFGRHLQSHDKPLELSLKVCPKCGIDHIKSGTFCSRKCANSRAFSEELNTRRSIKLKGRKFSRTKLLCSINFCSICNNLVRSTNTTCSSKCRNIATNLGASKGGKLSAAKVIKRSKQEIELYDLCKLKFDKVEHNIPMFNGWDADIIVHDLKIAISWNGPWHYKEMGLKNHSLKQVQNRDRIKTIEIEMMGWNHITFEDRYFTPQTAMMQILELNQDF